jgi:transcriptional regulator with XRE-family HTH domain
MPRNKHVSLKELRGGRTFREVSEATGIPISTVLAIENGYGNYSIILKHKLTDYYGVSFFATFPEESARLRPLLTHLAKELDQTDPPTK